jgi:drug/metabolite transporter (DMT)-like permease
MGGMGASSEVKERPKKWYFSILLHSTMFYIMLCFAGYTCIGRHLESESPLFEPLVFLLLRHWSSALILLLAVICKDGAVKFPRSEDMGRILLCGCLGIAATQLLFIFGLRATTATNAACIEPLIPCVTFILATIFGFEQTKWDRTFYLRVFGVMVGCAGAMVTTLGHTRSQIRMPGIGTVPRLGQHLPKSAGDIAIVLQCFTLSMFILLTKELAKKYSPMWLTAYCMLAGALFTSLVTLLSLVASGGEWPGWDKWHFDEAFALEEVYASLIASVQNYALRMWAIQYLHATTVSMYFCIDPPATALFAAIFLGESIHARQVIGGMLILVGMYVTIKFSEGNISKSKELENDAMEGITLEYNDEDEDEEFGGESGPLLKNVQGKIN